VDIFFIIITNNELLVTHLIITCIIMKSIHLKRKNNILAVDIINLLKKK